MDRISQYTAKIRQTVDNYFQRGDTPGILQLCGKSGMGKSTVARRCAEEHDCLYFSFRHMEAELAPRIFLPGCNTWRDFFSQIQKSYPMRSIEKRQKKTSGKPLMQAVFL